ncbi:2-octaprenyl-6-methoxyphenol hydroxylase [Lysobacter dokdonensis DS-58]|uniref:2-octaprenyl-6-methoxyphenol hydroxylase n=1 Tax=Lysobacter dokdonensis DS-58 TaxID=1300345 RepID=A0A0A2WGJ5_9GAMM|nr:2-octaprenyl-6-methoxyphenyl hydroxylase [Lysobacter dokdonensis]KGQ18908.1 2-octaprenyl-6-methoxyphenol hydroxylase [Lysobacter dokdonensis DS-58]
MPGTRFDVAIVGGGLVGASLAIALDRIGRRVALIEAAPAGAPPAVFDERNLSFAEATVHGLRALGVLRHLRAPPGAIRRIHVSRAGDFGRVVLDASEHGRDAFGQVVVARDFGLALEARLNECTHVTRLRPMRFEAASSGGGMRVLQMRDAAGAAHSIEAQLLVGADGTRSIVRDALGIGVDEHDFRQTLFVARVRTERAPDGTAYERFGPNGPTALLPRGDGHFGVVHGVPRDQADAVAALPEAQWLARLQSAFGWRVGRLIASGTRSAYPIVQVVARSLTGERAVLVGNAAQTLHPIGAQGFNLGLRDALTLAEMIEAGGDPGDATLLSEHARRRAEDRARTLQFSGGLARLTANDGDTMRPLRSLGFGALQHLPALRAQLVGGALGYRGDVPRLCRGEP